MNNTREAIYSALATELQGIAGLQSVSRVFRPHTDYAASLLPAGCLDEISEEPQTEVHGNAPVYTLRVDFWLYLPAPQISQQAGAETTIPMAALNNLLDLIEAALPNPYSPAIQYNTLGGLVQHVWVGGGKIMKVAGVANGNTPVSIARVPILILAI